MIEERSEELFHPEGGVAAVDKALEILLAFRPSDTSLPLFEISARTGLYKSTILRMLTSLEARGFVHRNADKSYRLGWAVKRLGTLYSSSFKIEEAIRPVLTELRNKTGESASFYVKEGDRRLCLFREESFHMLRDHVAEGQLLTLELGAAGRVLLHYADARATSDDVIDPIVSYGERDPEITAAAMPIFGADARVVGALTLSGPSSRLGPAAIEAALPVLRDLAHRLSRAIGHTLVR